MRAIDVYKRQGQANPEILLLLEDIIYEMRKDVGQRRCV